ncbi:hypothetical protein [Amycolatopsis vancoresmycina]|uniref:Uncharacterized protein n=1 Tax=Amycolatopsis vancoresmycina DSM 44592 TaxID=1292037 RepID=R1I391_9PSEU|nr:hypothetical protein [Amycolatopsis vancoresmycina]EOD70280.1 hypothetical protein H480_01837 [Amycolatopsis vancoresmycina DSM 44592]
MISLFLGLSETVVTVVLLQASGWVQGLLTVFATGFPILTAIGFFVLLWCKPEVLYAPADFAAGTTVAEYTEAMTRRTRREVQVAESIIRSAANSLKEDLSKLGADTPAQDVIIDNVANAIRNNVVHIEIDNIVPGKNVVAEMLVNETTTVQELLDFTYYSLEDFVDVYTYGISWQLINSRTEEVIEVAEREHRIIHGDLRPLKDAEILPTDRLVAARIPHSARRGRT